jgi:hypothetical protein
MVDGRAGLRAFIISANLDVIGENTGLRLPQDEIQRRGADFAHFMLEVRVSRVGTSAS